MGMVGTVAWVDTNVSSDLHQHLTGIEFSSNELGSNSQPGDRPPNQQRADSEEYFPRIWGQYDQSSFRQEASGMVYCPTASLSNFFRQARHEQLAEFDARFECQWGRERGYFCFLGENDYG